MSKLHASWHEQYLTAGDFPGQLDGDGFTILPTGMVLQYVSKYTSSILAGETRVVSGVLPVAMKKSLFSVPSINFRAVAEQGIICASVVSNTGYTVYVTNHGTESITATIRCLAIGEI